MAKQAAEKVEIATAAPKGATDFEGLTARLKPHPFKTKSKPEFFRSLQKAEGEGVCATRALWTVCDIAQSYDRKESSVSASLLASFRRTVR
jgi:hypothetical protein